MDVYINICKTLDIDNELEDKENLQRKLTDAYIFLAFRDEIIMSTVLGLSMQRQFQETLIKFYRTFVQNRPYSTQHINALQNCLSNAQIDQPKIKDKTSSDSRSYKSAKTSHSEICSAKLIKMFSTSQLEEAIIFVYFLSMIKNKKTDQLNAVIRSVMYRQKVYDHLLGSETKKIFLANLDKFNEDLQFLQKRTENGCKIQWLYFQIFKTFRQECLLFTQLLSSLGESLQTEQSINSNDYNTFCTALQIKCYVFDYDKKMPFELGTGMNKLYFGCRNGVYSIESQKQFQKNTNTSRRAIRQPQSKQENDNKSQNISSRYPQIKFKQQFLAQMSKLKQQYEINTNKIATLFNFKDSDVDYEKNSVEQMRQA